MYSTTLEPCNLEILKNPEQRGFLDEIQSAHVYLTNDQAEEFFIIVLSHFDKDISIENGKAILHSICRILSKDEFLKVFVAKDLSSALPFSKKNYLEDVFDVLYVLVTRYPQAFNESLCARFQRKIRNKGEKSLLILTIYSQHFNEIDNPWPMLELLFSEFNRFSKEDIAGKYASLLAVLVQSYPEFRRAKGAEAWENVCQLLSIENDEILDQVYNSLAIIANSIRHCEFPFQYILEHFQHQSLQKSIVSLLLVVPLEGSKLKDYGFIKSLVKIASENPKALLVLFRLAESKSIAQILVEKDPSWMEKDIPNLIDTLRLFLVVFQHKQLRPFIATATEFYNLMLRLIDEKNESIIAIVCIIIRRLDLTEEVIAELSSTGFIMTFMETVREMNTIGSSRYGLLLLDKIAKSYYTKELVQSCEWVSKLIKARGDLFEDAAVVATGLCKYRRCEKKFKELYMIEFFLKLKKDPESKKIASKFLKAIGSDEY
ncbi:hypothetical protein TRFO_02137 [Tritrichomonas foetus]|uniref:Uncharacterized protein n=1 Tax=Tritrichomonas foetus TaxID=1144522 RepID=A0A1J4J7K8_9EUKA|nr:hypothetical protein TRFO_02137 [Tritrichomonas foetus]|eukprot:OHS95202.1 hypothetical protein TRFO_02137 [Tritrichomonas foetus]